MYQGVAQSVPVPRMMGAKEAAEECMSSESVLGLLKVIIPSPGADNFGKCSLKLKTRKDDSSNEADK